MRTATHIIDTVEKLVKKHQTRDPYELCKLLGIKIHYYDMEKKLKGFFFYQSRQKNIVIDSNVNEVLERILISHELGHAILHTNKTLYVPAALLDYKFSLLHEKGELVNPMYIRKSGFLKDDLRDYDDIHYE